MSKRLKVCVMGVTAVQGESHGEHDHITQPEARHLISTGRAAWIKQPASRGDSSSIRLLDVGHELQREVASVRRRLYRKPRIRMTRRSHSVNYRMQDAAIMPVWIGERKNAV
jgi:hypothetical protein